MSEEYQIIIGKCIHKGNELDCYIPQVKIDDRPWENLLKGNSYILKDSFERLVICEKCIGTSRKISLDKKWENLVYGPERSCPECKNGLRRGAPQDNYEYAMLTIKAHKQKTEQLKELIKNL